jgi:hypothetical protein
LDVTGSYTLVFADVDEALKLNLALCSSVVNLPRLLRLTILQDPQGKMPQS